MSDRITHGSLKVSQELDNFLTDELLPGLDISPDAFWESFERVLFLGVISLSQVGWRCISKW